MGFASGFPRQSQCSGESFPGWHQDHATGMGDRPDDFPSGRAVIPCAIQGHGHGGDLLRRPLREIGQGAVLDVPILPVGLSEKNCGVGFSVGHDRDKHIYIIDININYARSFYII